MPYALKRTHPTKPNVKVYHTWDPDGDGYEEIRKFTTQAQAEEYMGRFDFPGMEVVEIDYEIGQDDAEIEEKLTRANDPSSPAGSIQRASNGVDWEPQVVNYWTAHGKLEN